MPTETNLNDKTQNKILMKIHNKRDHLQYINPIILNSTVLKNNLQITKPKKKSQLGRIN